MHCILISVNNKRIFVLLEPNRMCLPSYHRTCASPIQTKFHYEDGIWAQSFTPNGRAAGNY